MEMQPSKRMDEEIRQIDAGARQLRGTCVVISNRLVLVMG